MRPRSTSALVALVAAGVFTGRSGARTSSVKDPGCGPALLRAGRPGTQVVDGVASTAIPNSAKPIALKPRRSPQGNAHMAPTDVVVTRSRHVVRPRRTVLVQILRQCAPGRRPGALRSALIHVPIGAWFRWLTHRCPMRRRATCVHVSATSNIFQQLKVVNC